MRNDPVRYRHYLIGSGIGDRAMRATQDDVSAACERIADRGERPTVERVRAELGGASPNICKSALKWAPILGSPIFRRIPSRISFEVASQFRAD